MYHNEGLLFFIGTFYITFVLVLVALMIVGLWRMFTKAGEKGWKSLIPIYNGYIIITRIARKSSMYFWGPILYSIISIVIILNIIISTFLRYRRISDTEAVVLGLIIATFYIGLFVLTVLINLAIAKNFGQSTGFAVGLILVPFVFYLILAFGDSKFIYSAKEDNLSDEDDEYEYIYVEEDEDE